MAQFWFVLFSRAMVPLSARVFAILKAKRMFHLLKGSYNIDWHGSLAVAVGQVHLTIGFDLDFVVRSHDEIFWIMTNPSPEKVPITYGTWHRVHIENDEVGGDPGNQFRGSQNCTAFREFVGLVRKACHVAERDRLGDRTLAPTAPKASTTGIRLHRLRLGYRQLLCRLARDGGGVSVTSGGGAPAPWTIGSPSASL